MVVGWHGIPYRKPVTRTREYIQILRKIMAPDAPLEFDSEIFQLPLRGEGTTGLGKSLKSIRNADTSLPIYTASVTPAELASAAEFADWVLPTWISPNRCYAIVPQLQKGLENSGRSLADFDIAPTLQVVIGDDLDVLRQPIKQFRAMYIGDMSARDKNFYTQYTRVMGFDEAVNKIQDLYLAGKVDEATYVVPDDLIDETSLIGTESLIRERAECWKQGASENKVGTLLYTARQPEALELLADIFLS